SVAEACEVRRHQRHFVAEPDYALQPLRRLDVQRAVARRRRRGRDWVVRVAVRDGLLAGRRAERGEESQIAVVVETRHAEAENAFWQIGGLLALTRDLPTPVGEADED